MPKSGMGQVGEASTLVDLVGNALIANSETITASSAKSAGTTHTADLSVYRSGLMVCDVTLFTGGTTPSIQFFVETFDPVSSKWIVLSSPAAVSAATTIVIFFDETTAALPSAAGFTYVQAHPLLGGSTGQNYRVRTVFTGAPTSITYSVGFLGRPF